MTISKAEHNVLPINRSLTLAYSLSLAAGLLVGGLSLTGVLNPGLIYSSEELHIAFMPNDVLNLFIGLPILGASMRLAQRGGLAGLLLWPGALLYVLYNTVGYLISLPLGWLSILYFILAALSTGGILELLRCIDLQKVQERLAGVVPVRGPGWIMVLLGVAFIGRAAGILVQASGSGSAIPAAEMGTLVADLVISAVLVVGGVLLLLRRPLGYTSGLGLLFGASMLFVSLVVFLLIQPFLTGAPFVLVDVIVVLIMGLVCFIPFGLFVRGVVS
jgi:hypothetical protein